MFKFFKKYSKSTEEPKGNAQYEILNGDELSMELEEKFPDSFGMDLGSLAIDECFMFLYHNIKNLKDTFIVASFLRQIEPIVEEVMVAYSVDREYVNKVISERIPGLRVQAYQKMEEPPKEVPFFPGYYNNFKPLYRDLIERMDYLFEVRRNMQKLSHEVKGNSYLALYNNRAFLFLLNFLSVKEALIVAAALDTIEINYEEFPELQTFDDEYFKEVFNKVCTSIKNDLLERIAILEKKDDMEISFFDYVSLCEEYKDLLQRVEDTIKYLNGVKRG